LLDRISDPTPDEEPLEAVLADFGLVPTPRLLLLVEGETELVHLPSLVAAFANPRPEFIRVQHLGGNTVNPELLARYVVTPHIGQPLGDGWMLNTPPTALMIAVDEEPPWDTTEKRDQKERRIRAHIRHEVELQGGGIDDETLDFLVHIRTWGPAGCYELANFTDDELVDALSMRDGDGSHQTGPPSPSNIRELLTEARRGTRTFSALVGRCRTSKPRLAKRLWPVLRAKAEREIAKGELTTPVVRVLADAIDVANAVHPQVRALRAPRH